MSYFKTNKHKYAGVSGNFAKDYVDQEIQRHNESAQAHQDIRETLDAHEADSELHTSVQERQQWNEKIDNKAEMKNQSGGFEGGEDSSAVEGAALGNKAKAADGGAVGSGAVTSDGFAGGKDAKTVDSSGNAINAIQLGSGTNGAPYSLKVYDYPLLDFAGVIPWARQPSPVNTAGTGSAYTAAIEGVTDLYRGLKITVIPHVNSASTVPTLNVNNLGEKPIYRYGSDALLPYGLNAQDAIKANRPLNLMYDGSCWRAVDLPKPVWSDIMAKPAEFTPASHASSATTYGIGTDSSYGHVKLTADLDKTAAGQWALDAATGKTMNDKLSKLDYDKFTVTENDYDFTTSKRNVVITCTEEDAQYRSFFLNGTEQGQIITVYNPMWGAEGGVRKDVYLNCFRGTGSNMVTIAVGEQHTFQYAGGNLWDLEYTAAEYLNYGIDETSCTRVSRPIKRYYVEVPSGNTSTKNISITGLNIEKEKRYHIRFFAKMCDTDLSFKSINAGLLYDTTPSKISVFGWKEVNGVYTEDSDGQAVLGTDRDHFLGEFDLQYVNVSELDGVALLSCSGSSMDSASFTKKTGCIKSAMCNAFNRFTIATSANHLGEGSFIEITTV